MSGYHLNIKNNVFDRVPSKCKSGFLVLHNLRNASDNFLLSQKHLMWKK